MGVAPLANCLSNIVYSTDNGGTWTLLPHPFHWLATVATGLECSLVVPEPSSSRRPRIPSASRPQCQLGRRLEPATSTLPAPCSMMVWPLKPWSPTPLLAVLAWRLAAPGPAQLMESTPRPLQLPSRATLLASVPPCKTPAMPPIALT